MVAIAQSSAETRRARAAEYVEQAAFLGTVDRLLDGQGQPFGPPLSKLTAWRYYLLRGYDSPYTLPGAMCRRRHLWQALYLCSPDFRMGSKWAFLLFQLRTFWFVARQFHPASVALSSWIDAHFVFAPAIPKGADRGEDEEESALETRWIVSLMQLGRLAGFSPMEAVHLPFAILWPSIDSCLAAKSVDRPKFKRGRDKARGDYLRLRAALAKARKSSAMGVPL